MNIVYVYSMSKPVFEQFVASLLRCCYARFANEIHGVRSKFEFKENVFKATFTSMFM